MKQVQKRDGRLVDFDRAKIEKAIQKALEACHMNQDDQIHQWTDEVVEALEGQKVAMVESIQDQVEAVLVKHGAYEVAKAYILYRAERTRIREGQSTLMKVLEELTFHNAAQSNLKRENANIDANTAMGTMLKYGSESAKAFYLAHLLHPRFAKAHQTGMIHIHDLDFYPLTLTCCQIDLQRLFAGGFSTGDGFLREPNSIRSYASLACIAIQANQNDQHGGQSIPNFDEAMAPGVAKSFRKAWLLNFAKWSDLQPIRILRWQDPHAFLSAIETQANERVGLRSPLFDVVLRKTLMDALEGSLIDIDQAIHQIRAWTEKDVQQETYQAMEALIHNLNTMHSRAGAQVPFSSLNYGTDCSPEGRMVTRCLLEATIQGLGHGETPIFPIQIFKVKNGVNYEEGTPNHDLYRLAIHTSCRRLFPNFSFLDAPYNLAYYQPGDSRTEVAYMGCRTRVIGNVYDPRRQWVTGRGNLSFTSINLPRLALQSSSMDDFMHRLQDCMDLCRDQLLERFALQSKRTVENFPFLMGQGVWLDSEKLQEQSSIGEVMRHGTLSIGFIGLAECLVALLGMHHGASSHAQQIGLKIVDAMRKRCDDYSLEHQLNFTLLATPAEGLAGRFVTIDRQEFGTIIGVTDRDYYTNSFHIPVYFPISAFTKIRLEAPYHALTNAGHISYVELDGNMAQNESAFAAILACMHDEGIGYGSVNHPLDRDPVCGYQGIIGATCPQCGREEGAIPFDRIRRITGYLVGSLERFNNAKRQEVKDRITHGTNQNN